MEYICHLSKDRREYLKLPPEDFRYLEANCRGCYTFRFSIFFIAIIVAWNVSMALRLWFDDCQKQMDVLTTKYGLATSLVGYLFVVFAILTQVDIWFGWLSLVAFLCWLGCLMKYSLRLDDILRIMTREQEGGSVKAGQEAI